METKSNVLAPDLETMASRGVHMGALRSRSHPKMKPFVWQNKNIFQIIDLEKSKECLNEALGFLIGVRKKGGVILFIGTGPVAKEIIKKTAEELNMPYVAERWLGGTFTNFQTINRRVEYLKSLESQKAAGEFEKYTKYEAMKLGEKIKKLRKDLGGIVDMKRLPDAIWVNSANYDKIAVKEAIKKNVPIVGLVNTNADPTPFDYPIPANDSSIGAVEFVLSLVKDALANIKPDSFATKEKKEEN